jgi:hypothetical protein
MKKISPIAWVIAAVVVLFGAYGLGLGIRAVRSRWAEFEPKVEPKRQAKQPDLEPAPIIIEKEELEPTVVEEEYVMVEETVVEPEAEAEEEEDMPEVESAENESQESPGFGGWREVWADLNLTEEEQARLREGFMLAMERWQNMSPQEREAETERLRAMRERWENMTDEERQEASERMRGRFEEWRESDRAELPELSLD